MIVIYLSNDNYLLFCRHNVFNRVLYLSTNISLNKNGLKGEFIGDRSRSLITFTSSRIRPLLYSLIFCFLIVYNDFLPALGGASSNSLL